MPFKKPYNGFWQHVAVLVLVVTLVSGALYAIAAFTVPP
jgi:hypothetical protein